jgi:hypothetical protein
VFSWRYDTGFLDQKVIMRQKKKYICSLPNRGMLPARFGPDDLMTTIGDAQWAEGTAIMVSITEFWHGMWW